MDTKVVAEELKKQISDYNAVVDERLTGKADRGYVDETVKKHEEAMFSKIDELKLAHDQTSQRLDDMTLFGDRKSQENDEKVAKDFTMQLRAEGDASRMIPADFGAENVARYRKSIEAYWRRDRAAMTSEMLADMQVGVQSDGGYWVLPDMAGRIAKNVFETSPIRRLASVQAIGSDALEGPIDTDEMSAGWVGETETRAKTTTAQIGKWSIPVHESYAMPAVTQKLLDDANVDVGAWVEGKISDKLARTENTAFVTGDGAKKPKGLLGQTFVATADDTRPWGSVQYIPSGVSGAFPSTNAGDAQVMLIGVLGAIKSAYRSGASWLMNRATLAILMKERDDNGRPLYLPQFTDNGFDLNLLGFPVVEDEDFPDLAADSYSVAFGNYKIAYQIVDRVGVRILRDPYTTKGFVLFYATRRTGGDAINREAYKVVKFASS